MPTTLLNDRHIHPAEFSTWAGARRYHERHRRDRQALDKLRVSIPETGILQPLLIGVRKRDKFAFVYEGHHRAVIALELHLPAIPFQWFWDPQLRDIEAEPFPYRFLGLQPPAVNR
ncbi:ParB N-terminal domain-containing protein [Streptomyces mirabilis]|uniref:ParB N-terminal domain-containing protein n=1 Tax=Streptomyces mirabilis TaxID=68239 RepID=UPI003651BCB1